MAMLLCEDCDGRKTGPRWPHVRDPIRSYLLGHGQHWAMHCSRFGIAWAAYVDRDPLVFDTMMVLGDAKKTLLSMTAELKDGGH
jgi:hypothetical protein